MPRPIEPPSAFEHTPGLVLHDWHAAPHVELQQKPSTQLPLAHSGAELHAVPLSCCGTQVFPEQK